MSEKILVFVVSVILILLYWSSSPMHVDEDFSVALANGIHVSPYRTTHRIDSAYYTNLTASTLKTDNNIINITNNVICDGGNGIFYYWIAHYWSLALGPITGVYNSMRILSAVCHLIMVMIFFNWISSFMDRRKAMWAAILLSALSIQFNIIVRNYVMSNLFNAMLFVMTTDALLHRKNYALWKYSLVSLILPFIHFFNIIIVAMNLVFIAAYKKTVKSTIIRVAPLIIPLISSFAIFFIFYLFYNETGRHYQGIVNDHWHDFAQYYKSEKNTWLVPFGIQYGLIENAELLLRITGLDYRDSIRSFRIQYLIPITFLILTVFAITLKDAIVKKNEQWNAILYPLFMITGYLAAMNLIYFISDHAISINNQWYSSPLFLIFSFLFALSLKNSTFITSLILKTFVILVLSNAVFHTFNRYCRYTPEKMMDISIKHIENYNH